MTEKVEDWRAEIVKGVIIRQHLERLDRLYSYPLPEVAASSDEIRSTEKALGFSLDPSYRMFLRHANGWRSFLQQVDLFGTVQLRGAPPMDIAEEQLNAVYPDEFESATEFEVDSALIIGASAFQTDMWLLGVPWSRKAGQVLWFWGSGFETYPCFDEFFLSMLDYNRLELRRLQEAGE